MAYCSDCGSNVEAGESFCPNCGQQQVDITPVPAWRPPGGRSKAWLFILIPLMLVAVVVGVIFLRSEVRPESPGDVVIGFFQAVEQGNFSKARNYIVSWELERFTVDDFNEARKFMSDMGGIKKIEIIKEEVHEDGEFAEVHVKIEMRDGTTEEITPHLVKEEGKWKLRPDI